MEAVEPAVVAVVEALATEPVEVEPAVATVVAAGVAAEFCQPRAAALVGLRRAAATAEATGAVATAEREAGCGYDMAHGGESAS